MANARAASEPTKYEICISLKEQDAKAFETLTSQNIGKRILLMINHSPVAAPRVMCPISGGEMQIDLGDKEKAEEAMAMIKQMAR